MSLLSASEPLWAALCASLMLHQSLAPSELVGGAASGVAWGWEVDPQKMGKMADFGTKTMDGKFGSWRKMGQVPAKCDLVNQKTAKEKEKI